MALRVGPALVGVPTFVAESADDHTSRDHAHTGALALLVLAGV